MTTPTDVTYVASTTTISSAHMNGINDWIYPAYTSGTFVFNGVSVTFAGTTGTAITFPATSGTLAKAGANTDITSLGSLTNAPGTAPIYLIRAWGNFAGATGATNAAGNATCVRNSVGDYTVSFTTAMADANFAESITFGTAGTTAGIYVIVSRAAGSIQFQTYNSSVVLFDPTTVSVQIVR